MALPNGAQALVHVPQLAFQQANLNFQQNASVFFHMGNHGGPLNLRRARDGIMNDLVHADEPCVITNNRRISLRVMVSILSPR
jgi:hypothetical protein